MAESYADEGEPLRDYLDNVNETERSVARPEPPKPVAVRPPLLATRSSSSSTTSRVSPQQPQHYIAASERIKYALATSALLSANLRDALQLYPPLDQVAAAHDDKGSACAATRVDKGKAKAGTVTPREPTTEWPQGWETAGLGFRDRSVVGNAAAALSALTRSLSLFPLANGTASFDNATPASAATADAADAIKPIRIARPAQDAAILAVQRFITGAQELDLRVAAALSAIKELECIAHGLGLSDPLPPISRIEARSYAHLLAPSSPLPSTSTSPASPSGGGSPPAAGAPPPLRALPLRRALASALQETLAVLERSTADLNALLPRDSPLLSLVPVTNAASASKGNGRASKGHEASKASIAELLRHDERAQEERDELERFNEGGDEAGAGASPTSSTTSAAIDAARTGDASTSVPPDPFHPTDSTFGGIERRQKSSLASGGGTPHRLRESLSATSASQAASSPLRRQHSSRESTSSNATFFGVDEDVGGAATTPSRKGSLRRKRPLSLGGLNASTNMRRSVSAGATASSPSGSSPPRADPASESPVPLLLVSLQDAFDDVHALRRGVIWRLLEALSAAESDRAWNALSGLVGSLGRRIEDVAKEVRDAHELEFAGGPKGRSLSTRASQKRRTSSATSLSAPGDTSFDLEKEKRRRSGAFARDLLDADEDGDDTPRLQPAAPQTLANRRDALGRLTTTAIGVGSPSRTSLSSRRAPTSYADFAPSTSVSLLGRSTSRQSASTNGDSELATHARAMVLALRAVEAKLKFVVDDVETGMSHPVSPMLEERKRAAVETYDGIGQELRRVEEQWRAGARVLKEALGLVEPAADGEEPMDAATASDSLAPMAPPPALTSDVDNDQPEAPLGAEDAILQAGMTGEEGEDDPIKNRQALVDAALSLSLLPPPVSDPSPDSQHEETRATALEEKVFEAVAGPSRSESDGSKISREERIRRMKEAREALARGRESLGNSPVKSRDGTAAAEGGGAAAQQKMVGELQDVLREYNRERGRNVDSSPTVTISPVRSRPPPPPAPAFVFPPPVPFVPVPRPQMASPPPNARPLPPPPPASAPSPPIMVSPRKALPQTPPRNATSPVSGLRSRPTPPPVQSPLSPRSSPSKRPSVQSV